MYSLEKPTTLSGVLKVTLVQTKDVLFPSPVLTSPFRRGPHPYAIVDFEKSQITSEARFSGLYSPPLWAGEDNSCVYQYTYSFDVTRQAELHIWLYQPTAHDADVNTDTFLGKAASRPLLTETPREEWLGLHGGVGSISIRTQFIEAESPTSMTESNDLFDSVDLHCGPLSSIGNVYILRKKNISPLYNALVLRKSKHDGMAIRQATTRIDSPFVIPLKFNVELPPEKRYILCSSLHSYDLSELLASKGSLEPTEACFYAAQILCALDSLHDLNIVFGRLQPRRIYIDPTGYLSLGDFDLYVQDLSPGRLPWPQKDPPKQADEPDEQFTDDYLAPELRAAQDHSHPVTLSVDWWSLGVLLYEMLTGPPPLNFAKNVDTAFEFPTPLHGISLSQTAKDLLAKLLCRDPLRRLGANGSEDVKSHPFFDEIDWPKLLRKEYIPPFRSPVMGRAKPIPSTGCAYPDSSPPISKETEERVGALFKEWGLDLETEKYSTLTTPTTAN